ncbi:MAG: hypothetical protein ACPIOQ_44565, partial [Promethearchaeia archaeon]
MTRTRETQGAPGRGANSASSNIQQFKELATCCSRGDASESVSVSDMDWRSQASTVVPLESVDAIVQSASALAVEALKLGRNDEAQRIIRCARLLHENSGVSGRSSSCGSSSAPSPRLPGPLAAYPLVSHDMLTNLKRRFKRQCWECKYGVCVRQKNGWFECRIPKGF